MLKRLMATLFAVALICGLAACGSSGETVASANRPCDEVQTDLDQAKANKTEQAGTPAETEAAQAVKDLEAELKSCDDGSTTDETTTTIKPEVSGDINVEVDTSSFPEHFPEGVAADELAFGSDAEAAMEVAPQERGAAAHSSETLRTPEQLTSWLKSDDPKAKPVRDRVVLTVTAECGAEDVAVHMDDSQGWLLMVILPESQVQGLSYFVDGQMEFADSWRQTQGRDAYWLPICTQGPNMGTIVWNGFVRADCGNGADKPVFRIVRPDTPPAKSVICPPGMHGNVPGVCKDGPEKDPEQQGNNRPGGGGAEEGGSVEGGPLGPAGRPPEVYIPPEPPAAVPIPQTTTPQPGTTVPQAPATTAPSPTDPEVVNPPVTGVPPLGGF
ncbi:hypothetical protein KBD20_02305 [Candidatus Saccharibacteria bacterium]|nr:hypothetical protein [Candidatus Saccharibacteria bacterium]